jgi:hypothetical protein
LVESKHADPMGTGRASCARARIRWQKAMALFFLGRP